MTTESVSIRHFRTATVMHQAVVIPLAVLRLFGSQVLVFHFPGVIQGMKSGMPNQKPERPFGPIAGPLAL